MEPSYERVVKEIVEHEGEGSAVPPGPGDFPPKSGCELYHIPHDRSSEGEDDEVSHEESEVDFSQESRDQFLLLDLFKAILLVEPGVADHEDTPESVVDRHGYNGDNQGNPHFIEGQGPSLLVKVRHDKGILCVIEEHCDQEPDHDQVKEHHKDSYVPRTHERGHEDSI